MITYGTNPGMVMAVSGSIPERRDDPLDDRAQMAIVVEAPVAQRELAAALHVDRVRAVDHDFRNGRVAHQVFERSQAEEFVDDLLLQLGALFDQVAAGIGL